MRTRLSTWDGRSAFEYDGSVLAGTEIRYGSKGWRVRVTAEEYAWLLRHFLGRAVSIGTSRDRPPAGSVGESLQAHVTRTAIASYAGAILVHEGYAIRAAERKSTVRFLG